LSEHEGPGGSEEVGSVGEEAAKLFGALSGWARDHGGDLGGGLGDLAGHAGEAVRNLDEHLATGAPECQWCPVCRTVHAIREVSPEVREHLATAAASLMQAAAGVLAATAHQHGSARQADVEHIDLDQDDQPPWPEEQQ
jgi:hypothetical protein